MASATEHIAQANRNQHFINQMIARPDPFWDWVTIVAFYKAVHLAEALFHECESEEQKHSASHKDRNRTLKKRYPQLWRNYWHLFKASKAARYLEYEEDARMKVCTSFSAYMPAKVVISLLLCHYLANFETSILSHLSSPSTVQQFDRSKIAPEHRIK